MGEKAKISVIMIANNEEKRIGVTLESVHQWVDEIIVLDSGSTDKTVEIAKKYTDKVYTTDWPGYGKQKQRALEKAQFPWVLSLDADEIVTPQLKEEILSIVNSDDKPFSGYRIPVIYVFLGKILDNYIDGHPLRLFEREQAHYSNKIVHEGVIIKNNRVGHLKNKMLHDSVKGLDIFISKRNRYAQLWAEQEFARGKKAGLGSAIFHAGWCFFNVLFLRGAIFNGTYAIMLAFAYAQYTFNKYLLLKYLHAEHAYKSVSR